MFLRLPRVVPPCGYEPFRAWLLYSTTKAAAPDPWLVKPQASRHRMLALHDGGSVSSPWTLDLALLKLHESARRPLSCVVIASTRSYLPRFAARNQCQVHRPADEPRRAGVVGPTAGGP